MTEFVPLWRRAIAAEVCWIDHEGHPCALAATPVLDQGTPAVALPYSRACQIAGLRSATSVAFAVTDSRSLRGDRQGLVSVGIPEIIDDLDGDHFAVELLKQELVKYPPSRTLADSPLLCRENWWWLPRIIVRLTRRGQPESTAPRTNPERHALLVRPEGIRPRVSVVEVTGNDGADGAAVRLGNLALPDSAPGTALLFGHDYSMPDLERWESWSMLGTLDGDLLGVERRTGEPGALARPLRLLDRLRRQRALQRECVRGIREHENHR
ncbi:hypothetical protein AB8O38_04470 [Saccharomonospora xinjiangensis]|uniref:hypothetical protein n=1 Tax=Saccharomonospora xinjiangensis TaxID=75294 RepID=UPI00350F7427